MNTKLELLKYIEKMVKEYRLECKESIKRNHHMNKYKNEKINQNTIDAILVDFVNYVGAFQGVDYGLYTKHLK